MDAWATVPVLAGRHVRLDFAIERLGAHFDGLLRRHLRMPEGHLRDTAVYSLLREDWPAVRDRLDARLAQGLPA